MQKVKFSIIFYCLMMLLPSVQAQRVMKVLQPQVYSSCKGGITLSNKDSRVFVTTMEYPNRDIRPLRFIDCNAEGDTIELKILQDSSGAILFDSTSELFVLPLKNGDCILGSNET